MQINRPKISAVIPCLNEEKTLPICTAKDQKAFDDLGVIGEVVVGDNGSTDKSAEIATGMGASFSPGHGPSMITLLLSRYSVPLKGLLSTPIGFWIVDKYLNILIAIFLGTIRSICTPALIM